MRAWTSVWHSTYADRELSVGDYVLFWRRNWPRRWWSMPFVRLMPGRAWECGTSAHYESFWAQRSIRRRRVTEYRRRWAAAAGLLDYPHYTRAGGVSTVPAVPGRAAEW